MLGQQFYHETMRKVVVAFGTIFNNINIVRKNNSGTIIQKMKVPLAYGPAQKFLTRLDNDPSLNKKVAVTLPRIGFEIANLAYDPVRKLNRVQKFKKAKSTDKNQLDVQYMPVPYNLDFTLYVMAKNSDDALQIVEQILPYFQPAFTLTVDLVKSIGEKRDIPLVLDNVSFQDDYEGDFSTRRALIYTLNFTAKTYLFGPIAETSEGLIKKVQTDLYADTDIQKVKREMRYTVTPNPADAGPADDFGFDENWEFLGDGRTYSPVRKEDI